MATKPGNRTALTPQANRLWLPNQSGHQARPAMNAHNSARSIMAVFAETLCALAIPAGGASAWRATNNDGVRNAIAALQASAAQRQRKCSIVAKRDLISGKLPPFG